MFNRVLNKLAGDHNTKELTKLAPLVDKTNMFYEEFDALSDAEIQAKTPEFKARLKKGESLDDILPEAFAVVKQACKRLVGHEYEVKGHKETWFMIPFDVQILWGIILHQGKIAEMKTWEGKTIVATMPVYLNALTEKWVHLVTVNDWLASYQAELMRPLYERLGLSVGAVFKGVSIAQRRQEYEKDVTYIENSELGFDFLRDNLVKSIKQRALTRRPLNYAIVDEIDSILIDEARTPLIISEPREEPTEKYQYYSKIVKSLIACTEKKTVSKWLLNELVSDKKWFSKTDEEEDGDYYIDEKTKTASLSSRGIARLESMLNVENLYKDIGYEEIHHIENALRAQAVYNKDKDYIIKNGEILIVDEHTWRTMPGRRFSEGMHQAIEAKENVQIKRESKTMATITYQNFFKQFKKLSGMTGTAVTEWEEFNNIYDLEVLAVTTNKPIIRVDKLDKVYFNQKAKRNSVKDHIQFYHEMWQPILVGTSNIATSEYVSKLLDDAAITHYVLNAKHHEQEANIVSNAGKYKSIVVATNMAWRGTDIKLDKDLNKKIASNYAKWIKKQLSKDLWTSAIIYSNKEFEIVIEELKNELDITDEQIRQAEKWYINIKNWSFKIIFNNSKKQTTKTFAELRFKANKWNTIISKKFHFGLFILGTEKHESRRIDNQLRGRAGRQGDPGISIFFVALDDLIMRKMWWERIQSMAKVLLKQDDLDKLELTQKQFTSSIVRAQKQMEWRHFSIRKNLFDYDSVINIQRENIYKQRDYILESEGLESETPDQIEAKQKLFVEEKLKEIEKNIDFILDKQIEDAKKIKQGSADLLATIEKEMNLNFDDKTRTNLENADFDEIKKTLSAYINSSFKNNIEEAEEKQLYSAIKDVYLHYIDKLRVEHIDEMQYLREKVGLMWYAQLDPLIMYKKEAYEKFQNLLYRLKFDTTASLLNIDFKWLAQQQKVTTAFTQKSAQQDESYLKVLQDLAWSDAVQKIITQKQNDQQQDPRKMIFEDEDGVEVFEVDNNMVTVDNTIPTKVIDTNTKRKTRPNDPCPCGSGKKYKKCCGAK